LRTLKKKKKGKKGTAGRKILYITAEKGKQKEERSGVPAWIMAVEGQL